MESSDIKIEKDGTWYYRGAHMFRKEILSVFFEHLNQDECGRYYIELNGEVYFIDVEDTAFVVSAVYKRTASTDEDEKIDILLSDDCLETLDPDSLSVGEGNVMYCRVKNGRFAARFTRNSYYQLAEHIEHIEESDQYCVVLNNRTFVIHHS